MKQKIEYLILKKSFSDEKNKEINEKRKQTCIERYGVDAVSQFEEFKEKLNNKRKENTLKKYNFVKEIQNDLFICNCTDKECNICEEKEFQIRRPVYNIRISNKEELCTIKNPINYSSSNMEKELGNFIKSIYNGEILFNDRNILKKYEIDIYIPEFKIGFEFNGLYFHSEYFKDKKYHQEKFLFAKSCGITLVQIWEDNWYIKRKIIEDIIRSKLHLCSNIIGARKCEIKEITSFEAREFINNNHLNGYINSSIRIGLFYNNILVEVITFGKMRKIMNSKSKNDEYELYRFCTKSNYSIQGGFQKMLKYFIEKYNPKRIITYSSLDFSTGEIYEKSGFNFIKITQVGYNWVNDSKENVKEFNYRKHRFNFTKSELIKQGFDKNKTEDEIMHERGYFKCYDSGNLLFEMIL